MKTIQVAIEKRNSTLSALTTNDKEDKKMLLQGHAAVFDKPTVIWECDGIQYKEVIDRHAFDETDVSNCCLKYNHSNHVPILARVRSGNLKITTDSIGLKFDAELFDISSSRDVYSLIKEGGLDSCSFAFTIREEAYDTETRTRRILKIDKLFDVSIVDFPAYADTDVSARAFFELEKEKEKSLENESLELEKRKAILKLKLKLN